jgi:cardiolipin synthase
VLKDYCRIWRATGAFDHSKLLAIDGTWAYVGSSNLDARSLRLNFEIDLEVLDGSFARGIESAVSMPVIATARPVTLGGAAGPALVRSADRQPALALLALSVTGRCIQCVTE